jgi:hypothetical protein
VSNDVAKATNAVIESSEAIQGSSTAINSETTKMLHDNYGTIRKSVSPEALAKLGLG